MNTTQVLLVLAPGVLGYLYWVWKGESNNRINHWANLVSGLIVVPLLLFILPFILVSVVLDALKEHKWRVVLVTLFFLALIMGYGALIILLGDGPPPSPADLPVER